jgi:hypothetical protein
MVPLMKRGGWGSPLQQQLTKCNLLVAEKTVGVATLSSKHLSSVQSAKFPQHTKTNNRQFNKWNFR